RSVRGERAAAVFLAGLVHPGAKAGIATQLLRRREPVDIADLRRDRERQHPPDSRDREQQWNIGVIGSRSAQLAVDLIDLALEIPDRLKARVDGAAPGLRDVQALEQFAAGYPEQIADRARMPEGHERRVNAVLEHRAVLDQVQAKASLL